MSDDRFDLARFVEAQNGGGTYQRAVAELRRGRKTSHWMWFVFPQVAGLGSSAMSRRYAVSGLAQARAYLAHPVLGSRLRDCAAVMAATELSAERILGRIDAQKLQSSMTLFHLAAPDEPLFVRVLQQHFAGRLDPATEDRL